MQTTLIYQFHEDYCIVGTNSSIEIANAIKDSSYHGVIVIPKQHHRRPVVAIGQYAFYDCRFITNVIIYAEIKSIYQYAFGNCPSLQTINIPKTVTYLGVASIFSYNSTSEIQETGIPNVQGFITISFEPGSQLQEIAYHAFGRIEHIIIKTLDSFTNVKCGKPLAFSYLTLTVISNISTNFCDFGTTIVEPFDYYHDFNVVTSIINNLKYQTCHLPSFHFRSHIFIFILFIY